MRQIADRRARRGGRRGGGGPKSFLPNFRCLLPPPARAAAAVWGGGGGGGGGGCGQRAGRGAIAVGARAAGSGLRLPGARPSAGGGGRERAAGEGPAPPPQNEPAVGHRHQRLGVPAGPAAQLGLPVAAGHAPGERLRCLPARAARRRCTSRAGFRQGPPGAAGLAPALQLSQQLLPAAARRGGCPCAPPLSVDGAGPFPICPALPGGARLRIARPSLAWLCSALPNSLPEVPGAPGPRHLPAEPSREQLGRGRGPPVSSPSPPRPAGRGREDGQGGDGAGGSGFSPDSRAGSPFQVSSPHPTPSPSWPPLAGTDSADSASSSSAGGLKSFLHRPRWFLTQRESSDTPRGLYLLLERWDPQTRPPAARPPPAT